MPQVKVHNILYTKLLWNEPRNDTKPDAGEKDCTQNDNFPKLSLHSAARDG